MSKTWKKDTDDLFDFDTEEVETKKMSLSKFNPQFYLIYTDEKLKLIDSPNELLEKYKEYQKKKKNSEIIINNDNNTDNNNSNEGLNLNNVNNLLNNNNNQNNNNNNPLMHLFSSISKTVSGINEIASQLNNIPLSNIGNNNLNLNVNLPPIPPGNPAPIFSSSNVQVLPPIIIGGPGGIFNPLQPRVDINAIMNLLPSSVVTEEKEGDNNCIICLNDMKIGDNVTSLPCLHVFHTDCIKHWLESKNSCPICKLVITEQSLRGGN